MPIRLVPAATQPRKGNKATAFSVPLTGNKTPTVPTPRLITPAATPHRNTAAVPRNAIMLTLKVAAPQYIIAPLTSGPLRAQTRPQLSPQLPQNALRVSGTPRGNTTQGIRDGAEVPPLIDPAYHPKNPLKYLAMAPLKGIGENLL